MNILQNKLKELDACDDAIAWSKEYDNLQDAWDNCKKSDWMIWIINKMDWSNDKDLRLMAVGFARKVQHLMKDERSLIALDVAERYANGEATNEELDAARAAASAAARDAARAAACAAARAAAWDAASAAARDAARDEQCTIIRTFLPTVKF
jgi:hypothetical protein